MVDEGRRFGRDLRSLAAPLNMRAGLLAALARDIAGTDFDNRSDDKRITDILLGLLGR